MSALKISYDVDSDVLYLALGDPVPATTDEDDHGLLLRYARSDGHPCGVTVLGFHSTWEAKAGELSEIVSEHLHLKPRDVLRTIRAV